MKGWCWRSVAVARHKARRAEGAGQMVGLFLAGYGAARMFVEGFRQADAPFITPDNPFGHVIRFGTNAEAWGLTMGQLLSLPMLILGLLIIVVARAAGRATPGVSPLGRVLARQIAAGGPITVADYMAACLTHPEHGYYVGRDPLGKAGDFTTAPEISQMFGELIGLALAQAWIDQGRPDPFTLAELGPGRGTLMADLGRATATVPGFRAAARLWLLEASPVLKARQGKMLPGSAATWIAQIDALPQQPLFLIANEFFDALPVRQFQRGPRLARTDGDAGRTGRAGLRARPAGPVPARRRRPGVPDGTVIERRAAADPIVTAVAERIARHGGAALIVDYGAWGGIGDTLQAVKDHQPADPLAEPGQADLTAHVDFAALAAAADRPARRLHR